jgi:hypothetical protein
MRTYLKSISIILTLFLFISCNKQINEKPFLEIDKSNDFPEIGDTLIIVLNTEDSLSFRRSELIEGKTYIHYRKNFVKSPDFIINLGHYPDQTKLYLQIQELSRFPILYDSALEFIKWFYLSYDSYFLIEKKELIHSNSDSLQFLEVSFSAKGEI